MNVLYLKNKLFFFQKLNVKVMKVHDFNTNFPYFLFLKSKEFKLKLELTIRTDRANKIAA